MARVTPIPKKGDITLMNNLRPISNTPLPSKLLEKYVNNIIYKHIESNNLNFKNQNGFRKGRSTIQAVNEVVNRLYNYRHKGEYSIAILMLQKLTLNQVTNNIAPIDGRDVCTRLHDAVVLQVPQPKSEIFKKSNCYNGPLLWNNLPANIRALNDKNEFKTEIKKYYIRMFLNDHDMDITDW